MHSSNKPQVKVKLTKWHSVGINLKGQLHSCCEANGCEPVVLSAQLRVCVASSQPCSRHANTLMQRAEAWPKRQECCFSGCCCRKKRANLAITHFNFLSERQGCWSRNTQIKMPQFIMLMVKGAKCKCGEGSLKHSITLMTFVLR